MPNEVKRVSVIDPNRGESNGGGIVSGPVQLPTCRQYVTYHLPAMDSFFYREGQKAPAPEEC